MVHHALLFNLTNLYTTAMNYSSGRCVDYILTIISALTDEFAHRASFGRGRYHISQPGACITPPCQVTWSLSHPPPSSTFYATQATVGDVSWIARRCPVGPYDCVTPATVRISLPESDPRFLMGAHQLIVTHYCFTFWFSHTWPEYMLWTLSWVCTV